MMHPVLSSIVSVGMVTQLTAQGPFPAPKTPPTKPAVRDSQHAVVVEGCLRGSRLKMDRSRANVVADWLGASEFVLEGRKELLQQIRREEDGHQQLGDKTRITVSARSGRDERDRAGGFRPVRLKVESLRHIDDKCSIGG